MAQNEQTTEERSTLEQQGPEALQCFRIVRSSVRAYVRAAAHFQTGLPSTSVFFYIKIVIVTACGIRK